jgi:restriction system protein
MARGGAAMEHNEARSLTPGLPIYRKARHFLQILDSVPYALYRSTYNAIWEQRGSSKEQVDWTDPDSWISERLAGEAQGQALRIWRESKHELNPRYLRGSWYLTTKHDLLIRDAKDALRISERGQQFLSEPAGPVVAEIDSYEGVLTILRLVAERGPGKRSDFLPEYTAFCNSFTTYRSETVIKGSLYDRLRNLVDRECIARRVQTYEVTDRGLAYLESYAHLVPGRIAGTEVSVLSDLRACVDANIQPSAVVRGPEAPSLPYT